MDHFFTPFHKAAACVAHGLRGLSVSKAAFARGVSTSWTAGRLMMRPQSCPHLTSRAGE